MCIYCSTYEAINQVQASFGGMIDLYNRVKLFRICRAVKLQFIGRRFRALNLVEFNTIVRD